MSFDHYTALYESIYFVHQIHESLHINQLSGFDLSGSGSLGINESAYLAALKILMVHDLLSFKKNVYFQTLEQNNRFNDLLISVVLTDRRSDYELFFQKASVENHFFFNNLTDLEYDIYSRCDFEVTYAVGKTVLNVLNLEHMKVLELGGNSGGLGTALVSQFPTCQYTIVDRPIPCKVGNELKVRNDVPLTFIPGDVFDLQLTEQIFDYIVIMNLLHDFEDAKCAQIIENCHDYLGPNTKFCIIEDLLTGIFEPTAAIIQGLRLAVECGGGRQRSIEELSLLFSKNKFILESRTTLSPEQTLLIYGRE